MRLLPFILRCVGIATPLFLLASGACSSSSSGEPTVVHALCADTDCLSGNVCAGDPAVCRLKCVKHTDCPQGYECRPQVAGSADGGQILVCVEAANEAGPGNYGKDCSQNLEDDCGEGWVCNGNKNQNGAACTKLGGCTADADCPANEWCGELRKRTCVSMAPDADCASNANCAKFGAGYKCVGAVIQGGQLAAYGRCQFTCASDADCGLIGGTCQDVDHAGTKRCVQDQPGDWCHTSPDSCPSGFSCASKVGDTTMFSTVKACISRSYCAPCKDSSDCTDVTSACIKDQKGEGFCSSLCSPTSPSGCAAGNSCKQVDGDYYCVPDAGSCHGDASACAPCRNDSDCGEGICYTYGSSGEKFCMAPCGAGDTCPDTQVGTKMTCCTSGNGCTAASLQNLCLPPEYADVTDPRYAFGCHLKPCSADGDCDGAVHEVCWPRSNICVAAKTCQADAECQELYGQYCDPNLGVCRPKPCSTTQDCPAPQYDACDTTAGACFIAQ